MSGAEAAVVISLIASIITIVEATVGIHKAAKDVTGCPEDLQVVAEKLPILVDILVKAENRIQAGNASDSSLFKVQPILARCHKNVGKLQGIFEYAAPQAHSNRVQRIWRSGKTVWRAPKVHKLWTNIYDAVDLLAKEKIFDNDSGLNAQMKASLEELRELVRTEKREHQTCGLDSQDSSINNVPESRPLGLRVKPSAVPEISHQVPEQLRKLPRAANTRFVGYDDILLRLQARILGSDPNKADEQTIFVLSGVGGVGKSEIALQFVDKNQHLIEQRYEIAMTNGQHWLTQDRFWGVFWVDCSSKSSATADFRNIGELCSWTTDAAQPLESAKNNLTSYKRTTLLILDNCDDDRTDYREYMPSGHHVSIIMTSRLLSSRDHVRGSDYYAEIKGLDPTAAKILIQNVANSSATPDVQEKAAGDIAAALEYHPLAISVASSLIREGWCEIDEYINKSTEVFTQRELLDRTTTGSRYARINETFEVTARVLEDRAATEARARYGLELLEITAYMHPHDIRQDIFTSAWEYEAIVLERGDADDETIERLTTWHALQSKGFLGTGDMEERTAAWRSACAYLAGLSLVKWDRHAKSIAVHPLIHTWSQHRVAAKSAEVWQKTSSMLSLAIQERLGWTPLSTPLQRHLEYVFAHWNPSKAEYVTQRLNMCRMLYVWASQLLTVRSVLTSQVIKRLETTLGQLFDQGNGSLQIARCQHLEGRCLVRGGHINAGIAVLEHVVDIYEALAEDDLERLASQHALAKAYLDDNQVNRAIAILEDIVKHEEVLTEDDPDRLASQHVLASAYLDNKLVNRAIAMLEHVVKVRESLPEDNLYRLSAEAELAFAYLVNKQVNRAIAMFEHVVKVRESLPEDHPDRLASQHALASAYLDNREVNRAIEILRHVVKVEEGLPENEFRLSSQRELARAYLENNQVEKAVSILEHVFNFLKGHAEDHPRRLRAQHVLAKAYLANGQVDKAVAILEHVVNMNERLAEDNDLRLDFQLALVDAYERTGKHVEASAVSQKVLGFLNELVSHDHNYKNHYKILFERQRIGLKETQVRAPS